MGYFRRILHEYFSYPKFVEKEKKMQGRGGSDNFTYDELLDLADEFLGN